MPPSDTELDLLLTQAQSALDLFPALGGGGGKIRILFSAYPFLPKALQKRIGALVIDPQAIQNCPAANVDLVGRALSLNPYLHEERVIERLYREKLEIVLGEVAIWNPVHIKLAKKVCQMISRLCLANGRDGTSRISDSTLINRSRQMSVCLRCTEDLGDNVYFAHDLAITLLEKDDPRIQERMHDNWYELTIGWRQPNSLDRRYELFGLVREREERHRLHSMASGYDELILQIPPIVNDPPVNRARKYDRSEECSVPPPGGLSEPEMQAIIAAAVPCTSTGAVLAAAMAAAMIHPSHLISAKVVFEPQYARIRTPIHRFSSLGVFDPDIHLPTGDTFERVLPLSLAHAFERGREGLSRDECLKELAGFLRIVIPSATVHRYVAALLYQGPAWGWYPSPIAYMGLDSRPPLSDPLVDNPLQLSKPKVDGPAMPGWRYYVRVDFSYYWGAFRPYLNRFCSSDESLDITPTIPACGSHCVPKDDVVVDMVTTLKRMVGESLPTGADELVFRWNAMAGLTHLLTIGHLIIRNYPFDAPVVAESEAGYEILEHLQLIEQKGPMIMWYGPSLRRLISQMRELWNDYADAMKRAGVELDYRGNEHRSYGFWTPPSQIRGRTVATYMQPRAALVTQSLSYWPQTERFGLHVNTMRHWSSTSFFNSGQFTLREINSFHAHGLVTSALLSPTSRAPAFNATKMNAFKFLADKSSLNKVFK